MKTNPTLNGVLVGHRNGHVGLIWSLDDEIPIRNVVFVCGPSGALKRVTSNLPIDLMFEKPVKHIS